MPTATDPVASGELAAFLAAYECGTVQAAADALQLTQSAVTKRILSLERRLGQPLFRRSRLGVAPTRLGRTIYPPAKEALAQLRTVALAAQTAQATARDELTLSASHTIGEFLLPAWLSAFRAAHPSVHPQLEIVNSAVVLDAVEAGRAQVGFVEGGSAPRALDRLVVAADELVVVVAAGHPWARRRAVAPAALSEDAYLTRERDSGTRTVASSALAAHGISLTPASEVASIQSLKRMLAGGGFSILSRLAIADEVRAGGLVGRPLRGIALPRELYAVRRRRVVSGDGGRSAAARFWAWLEGRATPRAG